MPLGPVTGWLALTGPALGRLMLAVGTALSILALCGHHLLQQHSRPRWRAVACQGCIARFTHSLQSMQVCACVDW